MAEKLCKKQQISFGNSTKYSDFIELSSTFVYDYKMSMSGSPAKNSHLTEGERTTMMSMPVNRITSQCKIKLSQNYCP